MDDAGFVAGIKQGDPKIESQFYRLHYATVENYILKNSGSPEDARDIYQEAVVVVFHKIKKGQLNHRTASLSTFIFAVAKNKWLYQLRKDKKTEEVAVPVDSVSHFQEPEEHHLEQEEQFRQLETVLGMINELCLKIILAFYIEKMSIKQMTQKFEYKDENGMKKRKSLCMKTARENLLIIRKQREL
ncbi:MAG: RNA polymerase sigma factor [Candidatus Cyclobacteriaceae bacterium M3_2C_046]